MKFGCSFGIFLNSAHLICRSTDISKCFNGSLRLRDNASRLYIRKQHVHIRILHLYSNLIAISSFYRWWKIIYSPLSSQRNQEVITSVTQKIYSFFTVASDHEPYRDTTLQHIYRTVGSFFTVKSEPVLPSETVLQKIYRIVESFFTVNKKTDLSGDTFLQKIYRAVDSILSGKEIFFQQLFRWDQVNKSCFVLFVYNHQQSIFI